MARKADYYSTTKSNYQNRLGIGEDSVKAKKIGVSYGKYKAGLKPDNEESDYNVSCSDYVKRKEIKEPEQKPVASIRKR